MKVLISCEESQTVCKAFRNQGHEAYSNDIIECSGGHFEWHLQMDAFEAIKLKNWDLMIAHPPCTFLASSGARWLYDKRYTNRIKDREKAAEFFMKLINCNIPKIAIENPIGYMSTYYRKPDQIIQPYWFGEEKQKSTCLWLKNLPKLFPTNIVDKGKMHITKSGKKIPEWYSLLINNKDRQKIRSKTFQGIADAMASQWG